MQITELSRAEVLAAAQVQFPDQYVEMDTIDFYLPHIEKGEVRMEGVRHPLYASTHYVYEDRMVNGNKTRYKVPLMLVCVKRSADEIVYDGKKHYHIAVKDNAKIRLYPYMEFLALIEKLVTLAA